MPILDECEQAMKDNDNEQKTIAQLHKEYLDAKDIETQKQLREYCEKDVSLTKEFVKLREKFFNAHQVDPAGKSFRGRSALLSVWSVRLYLLYID